MPMEGRVKCLSQQNTSGVSRGNRVAAESNTTKDRRGLSSDVIKQQKHNMPPYCSCGVIQVCTFIFDSKQGHLHRVIKH